MAGFDYDDGRPSGPQQSSKGELGQRKKCAIYCSIISAFGAAGMIGLFVVGPLIKHAMVDADTNRSHDHIHGKFMQSNAVRVRPAGTAISGVARDNAAVQMADMDSTNSVTERRNALKLLGLGAIGAASTLGGLPMPAAAGGAGADPIKVYFGAGCFWHVQHEFIGEEVAALGRAPNQLTAVSGYAGGTKSGGNDNGKVCYHNAMRQADYGSLGHAEAVQVEIPESELPRFAKKYFSLFGTKGFRHDPQDRGGEYRSVLGLPGGSNSPFFGVIKQAALDSPGGMKLYNGEGNEPDTIGDKVVLVYDSNKFPFYPGEVYHQFHNDFMGPAYGKAYNDLQKVALERKAIATTGCPEFMF